MGRIRNALIRVGNYFPGRRKKFRVKAIEASETVVNIDRTPRTHSDKCYVAATALQNYWGPSGTDRNFENGRDVIHSLQLSEDDIKHLLDDLPPRRQTGTTGERLEECYRFLWSLVG